MVLEVVAVDFVSVVSPAGVISPYFAGVQSPQAPNPNFCVFFLAPNPKPTGGLAAYVRPPEKRGLGA